MENADDQCDNALVLGFAYDNDSMWQAALGLGACL